MKWLKVVLIGLAWALGLVLAGSPVLASTQDFSIKSFEADYYLSRNTQKTAVMSVQEKIVALFPDFDQNHGILRAIPEKYQGHSVSLKVEDIKNQTGQPLKYTTYHQANNLVLKIGEANTFVHGEQTYLINYSMKNVINFQPGDDELYWDVNGDQWPQPFGSVVVRIHIPAELKNGLTDQQVCYAGLSGRSLSNCTINKNDINSETVVTSEATNLNPYETLTFALGFKKDTFALGPEIAQEKQAKMFKDIGRGLAAALPPTVAFYVMFRRWRATGDDPKGRGVIIPEYESPKGLTALTSDYLLQQNMRNLAFSAAIIELAIKRYITIYEIPKKGLFGKKNYELELVKTPNDLPEELQKVVAIIFGGDNIGARKKLSDFKKKSSVIAAIDELGKNMSADLARRGYFVSDPRKARNRYLAWAGGLMIVGFVLVFLPWTIFLGVGLLLAAAVFFGFSFIMPARTIVGVEAHDALLGLKDYIKMAEADRLKFGQSPEGVEKISVGSFDPRLAKMKLKLFESLLPYAILFGLEKEWGKQFADIYKQPPDWYHGHWTGFNAGYLAGSLHDFSAASSATFTSSSSSSGSGFSGGSSGGGGGGGGGGGW